MSQHPEPPPIIVQKEFKSDPLVSMRYAYGDIDDCPTKNIDDKQGKDVYVNHHNRTMHIRSETN